MKKDGLLRELGLYGFDQIEDLILAGLVTGDPVLLVGTHGTAKTMLCKRLASALGLKFIAYDASKALFEDVIGFPNPYDIKNGRIEYVSTPISIYDKEFVLIDEISRANYQMQSKWLELIRSRQIMGIELKKLKFIFSAMNPPYYPGARTLDPALSGRFAFIIWVPEFSELHEDDRRLVISNISEEDAILISRGSNGVNLSRSNLKAFLKKARDFYYEVEGEMSNAVEMFIQNLTSVLNEEGGTFRIDGRRAGMIKRGIVSVCAVLKAKGKFRLRDLPEIVQSITPSLLPFSVEDESFDPAFIQLPIMDAVHMTFSRKAESSSVIMSNLLFSKVLSSIEKEVDYEKKVLLIHRIYGMDFKTVPELKRRFVNFHKEVFPSVSSAFGSIVSEVWGTFKGESLSITRDDVNAIRMCPYFLSRGIPKDYTAEGIKKLKETIINVKRRMKYAGT